MRTRLALGLLLLCAALLLAACASPGGSDDTGSGGHGAGAAGNTGTGTGGSGGSSAGTGGSGAGGSAAGEGGSTGGVAGATGGTGGTSSAGTGGAAGAGGTIGSGGGGAAGATAGASGRGGTIGSGGGGAAGATAGSGGAVGGRGGAAGTAAAGSGGRGGASAGGRGGSSGSGGGAGTGGGAAYQPCPTDGSACKILPFGDSITFGVNDEGNGGYRGPLFAAAVAAGRKITFTGSLANGPNTVSGQTFPKKNEGHSGWGISEVTPYSNGNAGIATVIPNPALSSSSGGVPHIVLLHIGTNDQGSFAATQMVSDLKGLIDKVISNAPDALVVVAQIIPLGYGTNDVIKAYNQAIPGVVQERAAAGKHIVLVDMFTGFTTATMLGSDSIHPNSSGYKLMADRWYAAIGSLLP
jgi:lysophospholipase L1-like esterase